MISPIIAWYLLILIYFVFIWGGTLMAYFRNERLPNDDPKKQDYSLIYVLVSPLIPPVLLPPTIALLVTLFILASILYGLFLIAFTFALLFAREAKIIKRLIDGWVKVGDQLLQIARFILRPIYLLLRTLFGGDIQPAR